MNVIIRKFTSSILYSITPGIISLLVSIFSIPLFLNILGKAYFGQYLIQIFFLNIGLIFNLSLNKILILKLGNLSKNNLYQQSNYLILTFILSFILIILLTFFINFMLEIYNFQTFILVNNFYIYFGILLTSLYLLIESLFKLNFEFKKISFFNLFFFGISSSLPAIFLLYYPDLFQDFYIQNEYPKNLVKLMILIKFLTIFFAVVYLYIKNRIKLIKPNFKEYKFILGYSKWITPNFLILNLNVLYDKFLIKIFLGNEALTLFSIPQQLASKISLLSNAITTVIFPIIEKKNFHHKSFHLSFSFIIVLFLVSTFCLISFNYLHLILELWLGKSFDVNYVILTKLFIIFFLIFSINQIINTFNENIRIIKFNLKIETLFFVISFISIIIILYYFKNIEYVLYFLLLRELIIFVIKSFIIRKYIFNYSYFNLIAYSLLINLTILILIKDKIFYLSLLIIIILSSIYFLKLKKNSQNLL